MQSLDSVRADAATAEARVHTLRERGGGKPASPWAAASRNTRRVYSRRSS